MKVTFKINSVLARETVNYPKKTRNLLARLTVAKEEGNPTELKRLYAQIGDLFLETEDWAKTIEFAREEIKNASLLPYSQRLESLLRANYRLAIACRQVEEYDLAIRYQKEQFKFADKLGDLQEKTDALFQLGVSFIAKGESLAGTRQDFLTAIDNLKKAERNSKELLGIEKLYLRIEMDIADREAYRAQIYMNIGIATMNMRDPDGAIPFIDYAKKIFIRGGDKAQEAQAYANLAICYDQKNDTRKAIELNRCENAIYEQIADIQGVCNALRDLGIRCEKIGLFLDARAAYKKIIENHQLNNEVNRDEEIKWAQDAIKQLDQKEEKAAQIKDLDDKISKAHKQGNTREEFRFRGQRGAIYLFINHPKKALFDFEWQKMTSEKLQMNQESISLILKSLAKAYTIDEKCSEAFKCYKELLRTLKPSEQEDKLDIISKISPLLQKMSSPYSQLERHNLEYFNLAEKLGNLAHQRKSLLNLIEINQKNGYNDKYRHQKAQLERIDGLMKNSKSEFLSDSGSIDSDLFAEDHFDSQNAMENLQPSTTADLCESSPLVIKRRAPIDLDSPDREHRNNITSPQNRSDKMESPRNLIESSPISKTRSLGNPKKLRKRYQILSSSPANQHNSPKTLLDSDDSIECSDRCNIGTSKEYATFFDENDLYFSPSTMEPARVYQESRARTNDNRQKIKVGVTVKNPSDEEETFAIPCASGPGGTPKTVRWLVGETSRRYKDLYKIQPPQFKLVAKDKLTKETETLFENDLLSEVIENTQKIYAVVK